MLQAKFEITAGTVIGRDHVRVGKNGHDAFSWMSKDITVGIVCDGCGSGEHSEVGSKIGANIAVESVVRHYLADPAAFTYMNVKNPGLSQVKRSILTKIQSVAEAMSGSFSENISDYFLFTILGFILDPKNNKAYIFGCGDGAFYVNNIQTILPAVNNAPPYLSYNLVETNQHKPDLMMFWQGDLESVKSLLIGTDGVSDLDKAWDKPIPGKDEKIGPMCQFWEKDVFFKNPFAASHRLALINRSISKVDWDKKEMSEFHGPLRDDTTFIAARRVKEKL